MTEPTQRNSDHLDQWEKAAAKQAPGGDVANLNWVTPEGLTVKPLYTAKDVAGLEYTDTLPGFAPFVRGPQPTMYAVKPWTIRQYAGFSTAEARKFFGQPRGITCDMLPIAPMPALVAQQRFLERFHDIEAERAVPKASGAGA